jgi:hypothetical protein
VFSADPLVDPEMTARLVEDLRRRAIPDLPSCLESELRPFSLSFDHLSCTQAGKPIYSRERIQFRHQGREERIEHYPLSVWDLAHAGKRGRYDT